MKNLFLALIAILSLSACSSDDTESQQEISQSHVVEFTTSTLENWVSVALTTTLNLEDGSVITINSDYDYTQNIVNVVIPENTISFELDFYIEDSSQAQMRFYGSDDNSTIEMLTINQQNYQYQHTF